MHNFSSHYVIKYSNLNIYFISKAQVLSHVTWKTFLANGLSISHEIHRISCEIHPKPYKSICFNQNYSVWWMQERGYDPGFHEIRGHSPLHASPPNWRVFVETSDFIRFWVDFTWNPPDFMKFAEICQISGEIRQISGEIRNVSFCVMIKCRSFFWKTKYRGLPF